MASRNALALPMGTRLNLSAVHLLAESNLALVLSPISSLLLKNLVAIPHVIAVTLARVTRKLFELFREEM